MARTPLILLCLGLGVAGCASTASDTEDNRPILRETSLMRRDGEFISLEELESMRYSAIATAETIRRLEQGLQEPWAEQRSAELILRQLDEAYPADTRLARTMWETTEPGAVGQNREGFREFGLYSNPLLPNGFRPRTRPATLEDFAARVLEQHSDTDPGARLLSTWRHFAPGMQTRSSGYLASSWTIELDYAVPVTVTLCESLLGPHQRCGVQNAGGVSFPGPRDQLDGYSASALLLDLVMPGPDSPVGKGIGAMANLADGGPRQLPFKVAERAHEQGDLDERFMQAVLHGLRDGSSELSSLPAATQRVSVTFSYLIDLGEARASLSFKRVGNGWLLDQFEYEPAAASLLQGTARLDLLPGLRGLIHRVQHD